MFKASDVLVVGVVGVGAVVAALWLAKKVKASEASLAAKGASTYFLSGSGSPDQVQNSTYWQAYAPGVYNAADFAEAERVTAKANDNGVQVGGWIVG